MSVRRLLQSAKKSKFSKGAALGIGLNSYFAAGDYNMARAEGKGAMASTGYAVSRFAMGEVLGLKGMLGVGLIKATPAAMVGAAEGVGKIQRSMSRAGRNIPFQNAVFNDYNQAYTMRQAGMMAAEQSRYNLQNALMGNEAAHLKR